MFKYDKYEGSEVVDIEDFDYIDIGKKYWKYNELFKKISVENNMYMKDFKIGKVINFLNNVNFLYER